MANKVLIKSRVVADAIKVKRTIENLVHWRLTTLQEKLIKIGAKVIVHARYVTFQLSSSNYWPSTVISAMN